MDADSSPSSSPPPSYHERTRLPSTAYHPSYNVHDDDDADEENDTFPVTTRTITGFPVPCTLSLTSASSIALTSPSSSSSSSDAVYALAPALSSVTTGRITLLRHNLDIWQIVPKAHATPGPDFILVVSDRVHSPTGFAKAGLEHTGLLGKGWNVMIDGKGEKAGTAVRALRGRKKGGELEWCFEGEKQVWATTGDKGVKIVREVPEKWVDFLVAVWVALTWKDMKPAMSGKDVGRKVLKVPGKMMDGAGVSLGYGAVPPHNGK